MKILYGIQATGNGHIVRALSIIKKLSEDAEIDILLSGENILVKPDLKVKYRINNVKINIDKPNLTKIFKEISSYKFHSLKRIYKNICSNNYDLVISDFEPISIFYAKRAKIPIISVCNQATLFENPKLFYKAKFLRRLFTKYFFISANYIGIHYESIGKNVTTPIIRNEIRNGEKEQLDIGLVYLPNIELQRVKNIFEKITEKRWKIFSSIDKQKIDDNLEIYPYNFEQFTSNLLKASIVITSAGFNTTTECIYLGKKLVVIPINEHYEQQFNASSLKKLGIRVLQEKSTDEQIVNQIREAINNQEAIQISYSDNLNEIRNRIIDVYSKKDKTATNIDIANSGADEKTMSIWNSIKQWFGA